ncbi:TPA: hypothetical protein P2Q98_000266 [Aeromonas veronii]|uniref:hypothetical protein n=1 Tax=Aeromonas veronii TaxID=654 RepID=UPI00330FD03E|nr:hypothetical protein [Aeromonas veronii]HDO1332174.1 hypothetical protein [Aeromonas veronii]HDO1339091.1 hypothetical protein [Aeromonas veronii]HDO1341234.1 hypothetical protein [Aeromonas veronii]HDO1345808.1 hypothetical protein [Aeromonas veronii]
MKMISILCPADRVIPWFDSPKHFREIGIFNLHEDGVWLVAEYTGDVPWVNDKDPDQILSVFHPEPLSVIHPDVVIAGHEFELSGFYHQDASIVLFFGSIPVTISVTGGVFKRQLSIPEAGVYTLKKASVLGSGVAVQVSPTTLNVAL